jgi:hypothetical protein
MTSARARGRGNERPMSPLVKVFGCLHDDPIHTRRRQAFEKRQWTKSREGGDDGAAGSTMV